MTAPILTPPEVVAPLRAIFGHHVARPGFSLTNWQLYRF